MVKRAAIERPRTIRAWKRRNELDAALPAGRFRKGRRAHGCPRPCSACRAGKQFPSLIERRSRFAFAEELAALGERGEDP